MSYDVDLIVETGPKHYASAWDSNITYNLVPMMRAVGIELKELHGADALSTWRLLADACGKLAAHPDKYVVHNPPNGWGNYDICLEFLRDFRDACLNHPFTKVHVT